MAAQVVFITKERFDSATQKVWKKELLGSRIARCRNGAFCY
jgi:hypothetical protein